MASLRRTYFITAVLLLLTHVTSHADCEIYLSTGANEAQHQNVETLRNALATTGSPIDQEILESLLKLNNLLPIPLAGLSPQQDESRPRSPYLKPNETWDSLFDYFYNSPSALTVTRVEDLNYLRHVLGITQSMPSSASRQEVLSRAHREWHLSRLSRFSQVRENFLRWEGHRSISMMLKDLEAKIQRWSQRPGSTSREQSARQSAAVKAFSNLKTFNSSFDLYLIDKYLSLLLKKDASESDAQEQLDPHLEFTDWRGFSSNLGQGSLDFIIDFAESASHDTELKAFLAAVLLKMEASIVQHHNHSFTSTFESSRWHVESELEDLPAPEQYESNLSIFTLVGKRTLSGHVEQAPLAMPYVSPMIAEIQVQWNPKLGRLEAWLANKIPLTKDLSVKESPRLMNFLSRYFDYFRSRSSYKEREIDQHLKYEAKSSLARNTYVVFTRPELPDDAVAMVKIFNGSTIDFADARLQRSINLPTKMLSSIETLFPHLTFEERKLGIPIREIGRMLAHPKETRPHAFRILMARIADLLYSSGARGVTYFYGVERVKDHHVKEGAQIVYAPQELRLPIDTEDKWIMRMPVKDLATRYFSQIFEAVRLRRPPPQYLVDSPTPEMIHSHVQFELPGNIHAEAAIIRNDEGDPSLFITHRRGDDIRHEVMIDNSNLGLTIDGLAGTESYLGVSDGRLVIHQQNHAIGRHRWERRLELDFVDGEYIVTRFTYSDRDTLDTKIGGNCDYDLIRGMGIKNGKEIKISKTRIKFKNLTDHEAMYSCSGW